MPVPTPVGSLGGCLGQCIGTAVTLCSRTPEMPDPPYGALPSKQRYSLLDEILRSLGRHLGKRPLASAFPALSILRRRSW